MNCKECGTLLGPNNTAWWLAHGPSGGLLCRNCVPPLPQGAMALLLRHGRIRYVVIRGKHYLRVEACARLSSISALKRVFGGSFRKQHTAYRWMATRASELLAMSEALAPYNRAVAAGLHKYSISPRGELRWRAAEEFVRLFGRTALVAPHVPPEAV